VIYLDNAATSYPKPQSVINAVNSAFYKYGANPGRSGHNMSVSTAMEVYKCREKLNEFFNFEDSKCEITINSSKIYNADKRRLTT
jgi:selenocysteine lyase/cysteine desulfurase